MLNGKNLTASTVAMYIVVIAAAVVTAAVVAPAVSSAVQGTDDEEPAVAVLTLRGGTTDGNVNQLTQDLRQVRTNDSIEAAVIRIDSSGGPVDSSEELYLAVNKTAAEMPVVGYVEGSAASGGYFGIVPSDAIVVKPSSNVGSIGVVVAAPLELIELVGNQQETFVRSGPDKAQLSKDGIRADLETLQNAFVGTVMTHRSEELELSSQEVANGDIYLGTQAVQNGFADRIGDEATAIEIAAERSAAIEGDQYGVTYFEEPGFQFSLPFADSDIEQVEGNVVYVDRSDSERVEFVEPVQYYAVWGVPASQENASVEVVANG
jgi:protease-4